MLSQCGHHLKGVICENVYVKNIERLSKMITRTQRTDSYTLYMYHVADISTEVSMLTS